MNEEKICKILGYMPCVVKETHEEMFRICISVKSKKDNYVGDEAVYIFLPQEEKLKIDLEKYLKKEYFKCTYETTDDIINNKSKVVKLIFS